MEALKKYKRMFGRVEKGKVAERAKVEFVLFGSIYSLFFLLLFPESAKPDKPFYNVRAS